MGLFRRGEDPLVASLRDQVTYLRAQLEASREREDRLRHEVITLASARAAAEIAFYETAHQPAATRPVQAWPPPDRRPAGPGPFDNHLAGGDHLEEDPQPAPPPGVDVDETALADATIENAARAREASRLPSVAD